MSGKTRVTTALDGERREYFERVAEEIDADADAETMREIVDRARSHADAQERADRLQRRVDELEAELRAANQRIDAANDLVEYVEDEREVQRERRAWERRRREAGVLTRARWFVFGADTEAVEGE